MNNHFTTDSTDQRKEEYKQAVAFAKEQDSQDGLQSFEAWFMGDPFPTIIRGKDISDAKSRHGLGHISGRDGFSWNKLK